MLPVEGVGRVVCPAYLGGGGERDCATVVEKQSLRHQHVSVALGGHKKKMGDWVVWQHSMFQFLELIENFSLLPCHVSRGQTQTLTR